MERDAEVEQRYLKPEEFYKYRVAEWSGKLSRLKAKSRLLGWLRLFAFLTAAVVPFVFFEPLSVPFFIFLIFPAVVFILLIKFAGVVGERTEHASFLVELNTTELKVLEYDFEGLPSGDEFIDREHDFTFDLDIFGNGSLFQYLNRTSMYGGYSRLAGKLSGPLLSRKDIIRNQEMVGELSRKKEFRQELYVLGRMTGEDEKQTVGLKNISETDISFYKKRDSFLGYAFLVLSLALIVLCLVGSLPYKVLIWLFFAGLGITGIYFKQVTKVQRQLSQLGSVLSEYSKLFALVEKEEFTSGGLTELKARLKGDDKNVSVVIKQLGQLLNMLDQRLNMFLGPLFNGFLLWDINVMRSIKKWHEKNGHLIDDWFVVLREFDALNSLAGFRFNHPQFVFPVFSDSAFVMAKGLGHPLIPGKERVDNDFDISGEKKIVIITGANMAGKSTFLRTVGVNLLLAGTGAPVAASELVYSPMRLITSMRAVDSLYKHESYFFSELKRLKYIVDELKRGEKVFFILDEILKGTNSHDKTKGSIALTERLLKFGSSGIIATHDLELGRLADLHPGKIVNMCFEVEFDNGRLKFDYVLRDGITHSHNATYLMENMGLI